MDMDSDLPLAWKQRMELTARATFYQGFGQGLKAGLFLASYLGIIGAGITYFFMR